MKPRVFKICISNNDDHEIVAIKSCIKTVNELKSEVLVRYPELEHKALKVYYEDYKGDKITIFDEADFEIFLANPNLVRVHVTVQSEEDLEKALYRVPHKPYAKPAANNSSKRRHEVAEMRHNGVMCNECEKEIVGYRYNCTECADYDLCMSCELKMAHSDHVMIRYPHAENVMNNEFGDYSGLANTHYYSLSLLRNTEAHQRNMQYESRFATMANKSKQKKEDKYHSMSNQCLNARYSTKSMHNDGDGSKQGQSEKEANRSAEYNRALMHYMNRNNGEEMYDKQNADNTDGPTNPLDKSFSFAAKTTASNDHDTSRMFMPQKTKDHQMDHTSEASSKSSGGAIPKMVSWNEKKNSWTTYNQADSEQNHGANGHNSHNSANSAHAHETFQFEMPSGQDSNERKQFSFAPSSIYKPRPGQAPKKAQWNGDVHSQVKAAKMHSMQMSMSSEIKSKDERVNESLAAMKAMGFSNEGGFLTKLLDHVDGDLNRAFEVLAPKQNK